MLNKAKQFIERHALLSEGDTVLVALSGGRDSVALLTALHRLGYALEAAHVNFQLRGADSDADEAFCRALCGRLSVPLHILREKPEGNTQQSARDIRYRFFEQILDESGIGAVATGHHLDDQLETIVFRFLKGAGVEGMGGIPVKKGRRIRPLLGIRRDEITSYLEEEGISWREDASNQTSDYDRNRIRHELLPVLLEFSPELAEIWNRQAGIFKATSSFIDMAADAWESPEIEWPVDSLENNHPVLWKLLERRGYSSRQMDEVVGLKFSQPGAKVLSATHRAVRDRSAVWLVRRTADHPVERSFSTVSELTAFFEVGNLSPKALQMPDDHWSAVFDPAALSFPLDLRSWKAGDRFTPLGSKGSQLISDLLVQQKVPLHRKPHVLVLEDSNAILWVVGYHRSDKGLITGDSQKALILKAPQAHRS